MKWLKKIIGRENRQETTEIAFHKLEDWVADKLKADLDDFSRSAALIFAEIEDTAEQLVRDIGTLETAEPPEMPPRALKVGLAARDNIIKQINMLIEKINTPEMDYSAIREFYATADTNLETTLEKSVKSHHSARYLFPKEVGEVVSDVRDVRKLLNKLKLLIDEKEDQIGNLDEISGTIQSIIDIQDDITERNSRIRNAGSELNDFRHESDEHAARLEKLSESAEWSSFVKLETELKQACEERDDIETSVMELFMPLNKAFKRMKKQDASERRTLSAKQKKLLDMCLENPIEMDAADVTDFMTDVYKLLENDVLGLKDRKREKAIGQTKQIMDSFASKKDAHRVISSQIRKIEDQISGLTISETKTTLERELAAKNERIARIEQEIENLRGNLKIRGKELEDQKNNLSSAVNSIKTVHIIFD
ncbi:MAG TPA: hypothetical protein EYP67_05995 [Methanosarcinales archaeon]|nr:hypothetical protein [Methanosarcinales archaeon]